MSLSEHDGNASLPVHEAPTNDDTETKNIDNIA